VSSGTLNLAQPTTISSSTVRTVADRHRLTACHNRHCWPAFLGYQHRWPWTPKIGVLVIFFANLGCHPHFKSKLRQVVEVDVRQNCIKLSAAVHELSTVH